MADTRDLTVRIKGDTASFEKSMQNVKGQSDGAGLSFGKMAGAVAAGQAIFEGVSFAIGKAVGFLSDSVKEYQDAEAAQKELQHAVIDVTGATQAQLKATNELADSLSKKGVLDDDVIRKGLAQLSTFGLTNDSVQKLGKSMADLTVNQFGVKASGDQAVQSANIMAKALNGNFGALEKMGIHLTDAQKHLIKFGDESQRVDTINQVLAANLRTNQATALETTEGKLAHLNVAWGNFKEAIGGAVIKGVTPLMDALAKFTSSDKFQEWADKAVQGVTTLMGWLFQFATAVAPYVIAFVKGIQQAFEFLKPSLDQLWKAIQENLLPALTKLWKEVLEPLMPIIGVLLVAAIWLFINVLTITIKIISSVIGAFADFIGWVVRAGGTVANTFGSMVDFVRSIPGRISNALGNLGGLLYSAGRDLIQGLINGVKDMIGSLGNAVGNVASGAVSKMKGLLGIKSPSTVFAEIGQNLGQGLVDGISNTASDVQGAVSDLAKGSVVAPAVAGQNQALAQMASPTTPAQPSQPPISITVAPNIGIYAGQPAERRQIAVDLWQDLVKMARAQGVQLPNINVAGIQ